MSQAQHGPEICREDITLFNCVDREERATLEEFPERSIVRVTNPVLVNWVADYNLHGAIIN